KRSQARETGGRASAVARFTGLKTVFTGPGVPASPSPQAICCHPLRGLRQKNFSTPSKLNVIGLQAVGLKAELQAFFPGEIPFIAVIHSRSLVPLYLISQADCPEKGATPLPASLGPSLRPFTASDSVIIFIAHLEVHYEQDKISPRVWSIAFRRPAV
ncbi:MAG: hypothetical protein ACKVX9_14905, partial [Blastocatellia bacterium]